MLLDTLAVTGAYPKASKVGNVMRLPEPITALTVPAAMPAAVIVAASNGFISL